MPAVVQIPVLLDVVNFSKSELMECKSIVYVMTTRPS